MRRNGGKPLREGEAAGIIVVVCIVLLCAAGTVVGFFLRAVRLSGQPLF